MTDLAKLSAAELKAEHDRLSREIRAASAERRPLSELSRQVARVMAEENRRAVASGAAPPAGHKASKPVGKVGGAAPPIRVPHHHHPLGAGPRTPVVRRGSAALAALDDVWLEDVPEGADIEDYAEAVDRERQRQFARRVVDAEANPQTEMPSTVSLQDRIKKPADPIKYLIEGWWTTGGTVVLAAQYKAGKTTAIGNLIRSLADCDPWLGRWKVRPTKGTISLLDFEMDESMLEAWLRDQHIRNADRIDITSLKGSASSFNILDPRCRAEWAERLREADTRVLVLDCLRPALDAIGLDEHKDAGRWFTAYDALLKDAGVQESVVVHHMGHNGERSRGDSRIRDWPAAEWRISRQTEDPASPRFIKAFGRGVNIHNGRLVLDPSTRRVEYQDADRVTGIKEASMIQLLRMLASVSMTKNDVLAKRGAVSERDMKAAIAIAVDQKWVNVEPGGNRSLIHSITEAGSAWLAERDTTQKQAA